MNITTFESITKIGIFIVYFIEKFSIIWNSLRWSFSQGWRLANIDQTKKYSSFFWYFLKHLILKEF